MDASQGIDGNAAISAALLKKGGDFDKAMVGKMLNGLEENSAAVESVRNSAMQANGVGQKLNITV